jgi:hypothetical protein
LVLAVLVFMPSGIVGLRYLIRIPACFADAKPAEAKS